MHIFTTRVHGYIDYLAGVALIAMPYALGFADGTAAQWVPIALGIFTLIYSLITRYELGAIYLLPMPVHLALDVLNGIALAASPWLFGFADRVHVPYLVFGLAEIVIATLTYSRPGFIEQVREAAAGSPAAQRTSRY